MRLYAHMSDVPPTKYENYLTGFEEMMMNHLHTMQEEGRSHQQYCETRFQNIEEIVEHLRYELGQMFYGPED